MKVGIGNDHAAVELKMQIKEFIESMGHEVVNYGVELSLIRIYIVLVTG